MSRKEEELNKELVRSYIEEIFNEGNLERINQYITDDYTAHDSIIWGELEGSENTLRYYRDLISAFPDIEIKIDDLIAEDDLVVQRYRLKGTHQSDFFGLKPTGQEINLPGIVLYRIENKRIVESWNYTDTSTLWYQLGAHIPLGLRPRICPNCGKFAPAAGACPHCGSSISV